MMLLGRSQLLQGVRVSKVFTGPPSLAPRATAGQTSPVETRLPRPSSEMTGTRLPRRSSAKPSEVWLGGRDSNPIAIATAFSDAP